MSGLNEQAFNLDQAEDNMHMEMDARAVAFADTWAPVFVTNEWRFKPESAARGGLLWNTLYARILEDYGCTTTAGQNGLNPVIEHEIERQLEAQQYSVGGSL